MSTKLKKSNTIAKRTKPTFEVSNSGYEGKSWKVRTKIKIDGFHALKITNKLLKKISLNVSF